MVGGRWAPRAWRGDVVDISQVEAKRKSVVNVHVDRLRQRSARPLLRPVGLLAVVVDIVAGCRMPAVDPFSRTAAHAVVLFSSEGADLFLARGRGGLHVPHRRGRGRCANTRPVEDNVRLAHALAAHAVAVMVAARTMFIPDLSTTVPVSFCLLYILVHLPSLSSILNVHRR